MKLKEIIEKVNNFKKVYETEILEEGIPLLAKKYQFNAFNTEVHFKNENMFEIEIFEINECEDDFDFFFIGKIDVSLYKTRTHTKIQCMLYDIEYDFMCQFEIQNEN